MMKQHAGFTIIELTLTVAILGILGSLAVSQYQDYKDRARIAQAKSDIMQIQVLIERFYTDNRYSFPEQLSDMGAVAAMRDPWGNPYRYLVIPTEKVNGPSGVRKDKSLHPINSDYDLYSMGKDGASVPALTAKASHDDVIRARNGQFVGLAADF